MGGFSEELKSIRQWNIWRLLTLSRVIRWMLFLAACGITYSLYGLNWEVIREHYEDSAAPVLLGVAFAVWASDRINEGRAKRDRKRAIIKQLASKYQETVLDALNIANDEGWLSDGSLNWANLVSAQLPGANLGGAMLKRVSLNDANLSGAILMLANLKGSNLAGANLQGAVLNEADLREATLVRANVRGANLSGANLVGARLGFLQCDKITILPDETEWTPSTDMARYSDPNHPEFWSPPEESE